MNWDAMTLDASLGANSVFGSATSWAARLIHRTYQELTRRPAREAVLSLEGGDQTACKPGSVPPAIAGGRGGHSSGPPIAGRFSRPTRTARAGEALPLAGRTIPIRSCSKRGLPCRLHYWRRGALLPHPFTLAPASRPASQGKALRSFSGAGAVCFLWRYPWDRSRRALPAAFSPWSPDFPPPAKAEGDRPAVWSGAKVKFAGPEVKAAAGDSGSTAEQTQTPHQEEGD